LEGAQQSAEVARIEVERARNVTRGQAVALADLVEHARLGEREWAAEVAFAQHADLARVEAVKASRGGDTGIEFGGGRRHGSAIEGKKSIAAIVKQLFDLVKYQRWSAVCERHGIVFTH